MSAKTGVARVWRIARSRRVPLARDDLVAGLDPSAERASTRLSDKVDPDPERRAEVSRTQVHAAYRLAEHGAAPERARWIVASISAA
jgi:hypothetical protein